MNSESESESGRIMRRWFEEVWNKGRESAIDEMFAADGVAHGLVDENGEELRGPAGFKPFFHRFREAFPDIQVTVEDCICEGERAAARCLVRATHQGDSLGVAATNNAVEFDGLCIIRVRDGKIVEAWNNFDFTGLNRQIGIV
ncbi:MAG TPA: ester cyclase [Pyrinomonadaceae bacterium]|nr:ester cyclase [Pyrinomonadaceae bacterium]